MTRRVLVLAGAHLVACGALLLVAGQGRAEQPVATIAFALAFALVGLLPLHLEFRRGAFTVVLDEAAAVVALFVLGPWGLVVAVTMGELVYRLATRQQRLKLVYNVSSALGGSALAAATFTQLGHANPGNPLAWAAALAAVTVWSLSSLASVSLVLAWADRRGVLDVLRASAVTTATATAASGCLGLATVVLLDAHPLAPVLVAPLIVAVVLSTRAQATQAAEHLRFQRLYQASARTMRLAGVGDALGPLAAEARGLLTGSVAVCAAQRPDGSWAAAIADDNGTRMADPALASAVARLDATGQGGVLSVRRLPPVVRGIAPQAADLVWARTGSGAMANVALAVFREILPDERASGRVDVLSAFAGHAALSVANGLLFEEVEQALQHQLDLNAQKDDFVAAVSHELRTPLTSVLGSLATIRRIGNRLDQAGRDKLMGTALSQAERLRRLIDELLLTAAAEHGSLSAHHTPVDVGQLVKGLCAELDEESGRRLEPFVSPAVGALRTDEGKLRQILANLVVNAMKYAPQGPILVVAERTRSGVSISVSDRGPGIPAADRERVFERFVQLDQSSTRRQGGTGLGLYLSRQLAQLLGGDLYLVEAPGGGARFSVALPEVLLTATALGAPLAGSDR